MRSLPKCRPLLSLRPLERGWGGGGGGRAPPPPPPPPPFITGSPAGQCLNSPVGSKKCQYPSMWRQPVAILPESPR